MFGLGGILPFKYMGSIMLGNGISGIACNVLRLIFVIALPDDTLYLQAQIFFVIAGIVLFICGYAYSILNRNEFYLYYKQQSQNKDQRFEVDMRV